ncbi:MAG TPA: (p)ppGpp synthetase [Candidatus Atribacteria bacterium]|nr:(p)ppGpp synthetase [Candidatus Atribacteria bacterium]
MKWIKPKYSKTRIRKAGELLLRAIADRSDQLPSGFDEALKVLSNWRAAHAYPMHVIRTLLRRAARKIDKEAIVVQRLKRVRSIILKLYRFPNMGLDRMQDIGGCRVVVRDIKTLRKLIDIIMNSSTAHSFHSKKDYIANPKPTGYRSVHLIYKYNASKKEYHNIFIEIQLRSNLQHAWATAVEIVDAFTQQALKTSWQGDEGWKNFFRCVSIEFARLEGCVTDNMLSKADNVKKIKELMDQLDIVNRLNAFAVSSQLISGEKVQGDFFILILDTEAKSIKYKVYAKSDLKKAIRDYLSIEKETRDDVTKDVVLVSGDSIKGLKEAYPNYFVDTHKFIKTISTIIS